MTQHSRRQFLAAAGAAPLVLSSPLHAAPQPARAAARPQFQLGLVSYNVAAQWDLATVLKTCKSIGVAAFEARTTHKHGVEPTLKPDQRATVKKQFADAGVVFWGCGSTCEFHAPDAAVVRKQIEDCKRFCELVRDLGGKGVKVRPNNVPKGKTVEETCAQIGKALQECGKAAHDNGVEIWVEVHGPVTQLPQNMKKIMDACGHKSVGVCWNSNATDLMEGSIAAGFDLLAPYIKSCHINDLENDARGKYPYRDLFRRLAGIGYDRYTLCEYGKSFNPEEGAAFLKKYKQQWTELVSG
ncbi:MAG: sugar phosphate isomerase/epimerase [Bacteroidales bacterium]|nr:sugar phosphate isomerase/epimerase [Bacteroidales bacterium]